MLSMCVCVCTHSLRNKASGEAKHIVCIYGPYMRAKLYSAKNYKRIQVLCCWQRVRSPLPRPRSSAHCGKKHNGLLKLTSYVANTHSAAHKHSRARAHISGAAHSHISLKKITELHCEHSPGLYTTCQRPH